MPQEHPDSLIQSEIADINGEFLRLLSHPELPTIGGVLGLDGATLSCLQRLGPGQLERMAATPLLLVEFSPLPCLNEFAAAGNTPCMVADAGFCPDWQQQMAGFANRLLTFIWHAARRDGLLSAFCLGLDKQQAEQLARQSYAAISRCSEDAPGYLQARLSGHPKFWQDLVRIVRSGNHQQQLASQLALIQLSAVRHPVSPKPAGRVHYY